MALALAGILGQDLIDRLKRSLMQAVREVEDRDAESVQVGITFKVQLTDGEPSVDFVHKDTTTVKGQFRPGAGGQLRLVDTERER